MNQLEFDLMSKCLEFTKALVSQGQTFNIQLTTSNHSFSLDTREASTKVLDRKRLSPSQVKRNLKRKEEFLKRKEETPKETSANQTSKKEYESEITAAKQHQ